MNREQIEGWRGGVEARLEELTIMNAKQNSDISHIKETTDEIKILVREQNGRVRKNTSSIFWMYGIISGIGVIGALIRLGIM